MLRLKLGIIMLLFILVVMIEKSKIPLKLINLKISTIITLSKLDNS